MSSSSSTPTGRAPPLASSSRAPRSATPTGSDSDDGLDIGNDELLAEDPLHEHGAPDDSITFNRKQGQQPSLASRFLSPFNRSSGTHTPASTPDGLRARSATPNTILSYLNTASDSAAGLQDTKDGGGLDWYVEGPGRRVGYDDLTGIDWIFEYSKERTRLRNLASNTPGVLGHLKVIADKSQIWWILVATGLAVGAIAASIDVASDWLGDLKEGMCSNVKDGGSFHLNKAFCCWETETYADCPDWRTWSTAMGVRSVGGSYVIEYILFVCLSVLFASCASLLVNKYSIHAKQSGIPEIKTVLGGFVIRRFFGAWTLLAKSLGLCLAVASGMWLGKEGPLVHVGCCCANVFMKLFPSINNNEARKREVFSAAAASGISVAFGSPIGGVLFSLEQLSYYFPDKTMWASFVCAMIAAITLQTLDPFRTGNLVLYQVTYHRGWHAFELIPSAVVGIVGGLYGAMFIKLNMKLTAWRTSRSNPLLARPILQVVAVALVTALISFPILFLRAQPSTLVEYLFAECKDIQDDLLGLCKAGIANTGVILMLVVSAVIGFFLASMTFGLQIPAGILLPSMAIGALYGRVIGLILEVWQREHPNFVAFANCEPDIPCVTPGTYAVIGAASALAGATRMTVSIVVIMYELTGTLTYVLPIMIAVMLSKWVGDAFGKRGIYESWIHLQGYPFLDNRDDAAIPDIPISQLLSRVEDLVCLTAHGHTVQTLRDLLKAHRYRGFPVITTSQDPVLLGFISRTELIFALDSATNFPPETDCFFQHQPLADPTVTLDLRPWMDQTPITLPSRSSLQLTNDMFQRLGLRYVVFAERGVLKGLLTKKDLWYVLNGEGEARGVGMGILREDNDENDDEQGLLRRDRGREEEEDW